MSVLVIIVTYNGMRWIDKCLSSLGSSIVPVDIFLIDNGSSDGTFSFVKQKYPKVIAQQSNENLGFGRANNVGMKYALENNYDYVMLLNQDAYVFEDTISVLLSFVKEPGIYSPIHLNGCGNGFDRNFKINTLFASQDSSFFDDLLINHLEGLYEVRSVNAACWFFPIQLIKQIGGFDPLFFHYGEDSNYFYRMKYHGRKYYLVSSSRVIHDRGDYGNKTSYKKGLVYRNLLLATTDINKSFFQVLKSLVKVKLMCFKQYPFLLMCKESFKASIKVMLNLRKIIHNRKANIIGGPVWLN